MDLVSLKNTDDSDCCAAGPIANYGYSLRLHLNDDQCEALGIKKAVAAGARVTISARAIVISSTESVEDDGDDTGNDVSLDLQITDMGLEVGGVVKNAAQILYGGN